MSEADPELDLDGRELCPDGSCTGVIGADGRCGECGASEAKVMPSTGNPFRDADPEDFADRKLCPDGDCIGLVDAVDGCCKVCGRPGE